jgi:hypothetical protein
VAQQCILGIGHLIVEVSKSHTHLLGLLYTSDKLIAEATAYTTHNIHNRWDSNPHSKHSSGFRPMCETARAPGSAHIIYRVAQ